MALGSMLSDDGILKAEDVGDGPELVKEPHFDAKATESCIFIYMAVAPLKNWICLTPA